MSKNKDVKRGIVLYIDGKEVKRDVTDIKAEIRKLTKELSHMTIGSKEYNDQMAKIKHLNSIVRDHKMRLREVNEELGKNRFSVGKLVDGFNRFGGVIVSVIGFLTGFVLALRSIREERNKLEESQAGLKALTGLDDESITWLTAQAKNLSTTMTKEGLRVRQSAAEILDAFMLVGSAKPELLGNKEALRQVTEEAMRLQAAAKDITLNEAVDSLTLSLNQYGAAADQAGKFSNVLAAGSKAGSANIASQAKAIRISGTAAAAANISIEQTVGLIETLAYKGIKDEVAGTGLKRFFLKLQTGADETNPKIVGLDKALENLRSKNMDAGAIKKMFGEEGFNAASVILHNTEMVNDFTKAVTGTNIAYEQSAINSATAAAKLDQARNEMKLAAIELGERLNPAFTVSTNMMANIVKFLPGLIDWFEKWGGTIIKLAGFIAIYTAYTKAQIIEEKLTVFWKERIIATSKRLYATIAKHPYAALGIAIVALISYLRSLNKEMTESERIEKTLNEIRDTAAANIADEKSQLQQYLSIARDEKKSKIEREAAIRRINELSPEYLGNLTLEKINTQEATSAVNKYVDSLLILEEIRQTQSKMNDLRAQREALMKNGPDNSFLDDAEAGAANMLNQFKTSLGLYTDSWADNVLNQYTNKGVEQLRSIDKELSVLDERIISSRQKLIDLEIKGKETVTTTIGGSTGDNGEDNKKEKDKFAKVEEAYYQRISAIKKKYLADDTMTQEEYNQQMQQAEMQLLQDKLKVKGLEPSEIQHLNDLILNAEIKARDELRKLDEQSVKDTEKMQKEQSEKTFSRLDKEYQMQIEGATMYHYKNKTSEKEYLNELRHLQKNYYDKVLNDTAVSEEDKQKIRKQNSDAEIEDAKKKYEAEVEAFTNMKDNMIDVSKQLGESMAEFFTNEEQDFGDFMKNVLVILLDTLEKQLIATQAAAIAEVIIKDISLKGLLGLAAAAGKIALITAAFETAKGLLGNFYTGGYTGSGDWDQPQGIVHSNEFVANRYAVANPAVRPVLDLIDNAQRTGSIGNLTAEDMSAVVGTSPRRIDSSAPKLKYIYDNRTDDKMTNMMIQLTQVIDKLKTRLDEPLISETYVTGKRGINQAMKEYNVLQNNISRRK